MVRVTCATEEMTKFMIMFHLPKCSDFEVLFLGDVASELGWLMTLYGTAFPYTNLSMRGFSTEVSTGDLSRTNLQLQSG